MKFITLLMLSTLVASVSNAQSTYVAVGEAKTKRPVLALIPSDPAIEKTIESDLTWVDQFTFLPSSAFPQATVSGVGDIKTAEWLKTGADYLGFSTYKLEAGKVVYEFHLFVLGSNHEILAKRYTSTPSETKVLAHTVANDVLLNITGRKGIFLTKIAMVCDKTGKKELYTMNFDGTDARQITKLHSLTMSPAWSTDGNKMGFSVYNHHSDGTKNLDLFEYNFKTAALRMISNKKGINSGATYQPGSNKIAATLSYSGNPNLYLIDTETKNITPLTKSLGFDVDPNFSPDGSKLAFVSSRSGNPMVFVTDVATPSNAKRLTYAGKYNASPSWAPDSKKIVFAGWLEKHFDIFTITADGAKIDRLTKDEDNNEDPNYSPDGSFVVFTSGRSGGKNIFVMGSDGRNAKRLTFGMGSCAAPKWSPYLN
jgi:TolB protein